jgi:tripartite-type tricarboxylate transporter receptor subunit TctC
MNINGEKMIRRIALALVLAVLCAIPAATAQVSGYPSRPVRIVVPFKPGGTTDILARELGQKLHVALGQPFVIDNRPGAGGSVGAEQAARAEPNGYTVMMGHIGTLAVNPTLYPNLGYDAVKDFAPVAWVARVPNVLAVHPSVPATNVAELVALAKAKPDGLDYGSGGNGSAAHLATEYLKLVTQTRMVHVPYRGTAPLVTDLVAGQIQVGFTGAPAVMPMVRAGMLRAIAVSSPTRMPALPDLPTVAEAGYQGFEADQWYGIVAPSGTPREIVLRLNAEINKAMSSPELTARLAQEGAVAMTTTPEAYGELIKSEIARWRPVLQAANVKVE